MNRAVLWVLVSLLSVVFFAPTAVAKDASATVAKRHAAKKLVVKKSSVSKRKQASKRRR